MSVVSIKEIHDGRDGGDDISNDGAKSDITRRFRVYTSSPYDGADTVLQACDNLGVVHPTANWLFIKSRRAANEPYSKLVWIVTLKYESYKGSQQTPTTNPLSMPAEVTWNTEQSQENATRDKNGYAILNSAGDYYEDGATVEVSRWVAKVTKNIPYMPSWIDSYRDAINTDSFYLDGMLITARTAKMSSISIGAWSFQNNVRYRQLEMQIKIRETWIKYILDQGLRREIDGLDGWLEKCIDSDGAAVTKPVLLDGSGGQLDSPTPETAVFNAHYIYPEMPFSYLPLY